MTLDPIQLRALGALVEKEITTPENYPLSLNSLIAACNQRSSREPVMDLTEDQVRQAVHSLEDLGLVVPVRDSRVPKYENRIRTVLNLRRDETAVMCLLMLRGPQTPGELRGRADRMYSFDDIGAVQSTLERLASRGSGGAENVAGESGALVVQLARQPGSRESRYAHLLGGAISGAEPVRFGKDAKSPAQAAGRVAEQPSGRPGEYPDGHLGGHAGEHGSWAEMAERVAALEAAVEALRRENEELRRRIEVLIGT